jgi:pyridoxamine 5'-phosphate oxidase family protein
MVLGSRRPPGARMSFTDSEVAYLQSQPLARLSTLNHEGRPDMVPVAFEFDGSSFWVGGSGASVLETRRMRNIRSDRDRVALVIDDLVSFDPFIVRGVRIYGVAATPVERIGMVGPGVFTEIMPTIPWSWNMEGKPVGDAWYEARRAVRSPR